MARWPPSPDRKYGPRPDQSPEARHALFEALTRTVSPTALIETDQHSHYPVLTRAHFPAATHRRYKGAKGCVTGQGEMKKLAFDPLFAINHTLAMFRDRIKRLTRRTWCTTKRADRLSDLIAIYIDYHRQKLLKLPAEPATLET